MGSISKILVGTALFSALTYGVVKAVKVVKTSNAADKLDYDIDGFTLKHVNRNGIGLPVSLIYTISLKLNNPTDQDLVISKPYIKLSIKKALTLYKIANTSIPENTQINIKAKQSTQFKHDVEIRITNLLPVLPNALQYILSRISGSKSTQSIIADCTLDSMGITIPIQKTIAL